MDFKLVISLLALFLVISSSNPLSLSLNVDFKDNVKRPPILSENYTLRGVMTIQDSRGSVELDWYHTRKRVAIPDSRVDFAEGDELINGYNEVNANETFMILRNYKSTGFSKEYVLVNVPDRRTGLYVPVCDVKSSLQGMPLAWDWLSCTKTYADGEYYLDVFGEKIFVVFAGNVPVRIERTGRGGRKEDLKISFYENKYETISTKPPAACL